MRVPIVTQDALGRADDLRDTAQTFELVSVEQPIAITFERVALIVGQSPFVHAARAGITAL